MEALGKADPIYGARLRHERYIAVIVLALAVLSTAIVGWRILTVESTSGIRILAFIAVISVYYTRVLFERRLVRAKLWFRTTLEVSGASLVLTLDAAAGPDFLFTSSASYVYLLAVAISCLRLDTMISAYAAVIAIVEQLAIYLYVFEVKGAELPIMGGAISRPRMFQELGFRLGVCALIGVLGFLLARTLKREITQAAEEARVRAAFGSYVDRRVMKRVLAGDLKMEPERRIITVMFVDIRNFTGLTESSDPAELFAMLNDTLDAFAAIVQRQGGIVNKFLGDGLMAIFGAPEAQADHPRRSIRTALLVAEEARKRCEAKSFPNLAIGIGIHTGETIVGDIGGKRREYTAIGDVVNVAARVESANKELGTTILITRAMKDAVGDDVETRETPPVSLRGRVGQIELFEVRGMREDITKSVKVKSEPKSADAPA
ncbi:MAG: Adenylate cyclase [Myxococcaceae bacterium]|jgi:adenylate cyclase|nr:Adenylate cyclase [Myxococcaceae bacterium]